MGASCGVCEPPDFRPATLADWAHTRDQHAIVPLRDCSYSASLMPIPGALRSAKDPHMLITRDFASDSSHKMAMLALCISVDGKVVLFDLSKQGRPVRELNVPSEALSVRFLGTSGSCPQLLASGDIAVAFTPEGNEVRIWCWPQSLDPACIAVEEQRDVLQVALLLI